MPNYFVMDGDGDEPATWEVETRDDGSYRVVTPDGEELVVDAFEPDERRLHLLAGDDSHDVAVHESDENFEVCVDGQRHHVDVLNEREKRMREAGVGGRGARGPDLESPMAGTVVDISVDEGDGVEEEETVVIVEAMKMENDLKAHKSGAIEVVHVEVGDSVEIGDALVSIGD